MIFHLLAAVVAQGAQSPELPPVTSCDPFEIFFDEGSATLSRPAQVLIDNIAAAWAGNRMGDRPTWKLGNHADAPGPEEYNFKLSRLRGEAVKAALVAKGMPSGMLIVDARGETDFLVPTDESHVYNRRVQVENC